MVQLAWRVLVVASALGGYALAVADFGGTLHALSQLASLVTGGCYALLAVSGVVRRDAAWPWLTGALATTLGLVWGTFLFVLGGSYAHGYSLLEHLVTPALVVLDFVVVGPWLAARTTEGAGRTAGPRWWWPATWLALPLGYLTWYAYGDLDVYSFLDPRDPGYPGVVGAFLGATLALAYLLYAARGVVEKTLVFGEPAA
jgi:hypothetical protein